jgi:hypothetical protein
MVLNSMPRRLVGNRRSDTSMQDTGAVQQPRAQGQLNRYAIAMFA